jgi:hypothetical protein
MDTTLSEDGFLELDQLPLTREYLVSSLRSFLKKLFFQFLHLSHVKNDFIIHLYDGHL